MSKIKQNEEEDDDDQRIDYFFNFKQKQTASSNAFQFSFNDDAGVITSYIFVNNFTLYTNPSSQAIN